MKQEEELGWKLEGNREGVGCHLILSSKRVNISSSSITRVLLRIEHLFKYSELTKGEGTILKQKRKERMPLTSIDMSIACSIDRPINSDRPLVGRPLGVWL